MYFVDMHICHIRITICYIITIMFNIRITTYDIQITTPHVIFMSNAVTNKKTRYNQFIGCSG